ncbi:hypothetical protein GCM10017559_17650 [Streptosporangium longisporum]|uniref:Uncharacterized protein n=1 Tax=Streptosporangium longisporum TaxID=46187 RepID=A0ABN3XUC8_9ACTN
MPGRAAFPATGDRTVPCSGSPSEPPKLTGTAFRSAGTTSGGPPDDGAAGDGVAGDGVAGEVRDELVSDTFVTDGVPADDDTGKDAPAGEGPAGERPAGGERADRKRAAVTTRRSGLMCRTYSAEKALQTLSCRDPSVGVGCSS